MLYVTNCRVGGWGGIVIPMSEALRAADKKKVSKRTIFQPETLISTTKGATFCPKKCPIFCHHMHSQNYKLTPAPSENASHFRPPLMFEKL
jgi:hypothetical protein